MLGRFALVVALSLIPVGELSAQARTSKCCAERDALLAENLTLRKEIETLHARVTQVADESRKAEDEALRAVRAVQSAQKDASAIEIRKYVTEARIKVDQLPDGAARTAALRSVLDAQSAAIEVTIRGARHASLLQEELDPMIARFPELKSRVRGTYISKSPIPGEKPYYLYSAGEVGLALMAIASDRLSAIER